MVNSTDINSVTSPVDYPNPVCKFVLDGSTFSGKAIWMDCSEANQYGGFGDRRLQEVQATRTRILDDESQCLFCFSPKVSEIGYATVYVSLSGTYDNSDATAEFRYYSQPVINSLSPILGPASGGTPIQVYGSDFIDVETYCAFGISTTIAQFVSSSNLICYAPSSEVIDSFVYMEITLNNQQYTQDLNKYYYYEDPSITTANPAVSPLSGGINVTVCGDYLYPFFDVKLDISAQDYFFVKFGSVWVNGSLINETCFWTTAPAQSEVGFVNVSITFNSFDFSIGEDIFYYYYVPGVSGIQNRDSSGDIAGSPDNIIVYGGPFDSKTNYTCQFGDETTEGDYINSTAISCPVPDDVKESGDSYPLSIGENGNYTSPIEVKFPAAPSLISVFPKCGYTTGDTLVTVTGSSFSSLGENEVTCLFNSSWSSFGVIYNDETIYCSNPPIEDHIELPASMSISLSFPNGALVDGSDVSYVYMSPPKTIRVSPSYGKVAGGGVAKLYFDESGNYSTCGTGAKFGTHDAELVGTYSDQGALRLIVPEAVYQDDVIPHVTLNGQDYVPASSGVFYSYIDYPESTMIIPTTGSKSGGFEVTVLGNGFDLDRQGGLEDASYTCVFYAEDQSTPYAEVEASSWTPYGVECLAPAASDESSLNVEVELNGQTCQNTGINTLYFEETSSIDSVDPEFIEVSNQGEISTVTLDGEGLECQTSSNCAPQCSFRLTSDTSVVFYTKGYEVSSSTALCEIPYVPVSSSYYVNYAADGVTFTSSLVQFSYYSPYPLTLNPNYIDIDLSSVSTIVSGVGFFNSSTLVYKLSPIDSSISITCSGSQCQFLNIDYLNSSALNITSLPNYDDIEFSKVPENKYVFDVCISFDEGQTFSSNQLLLTYYSSPVSSGSTSSGSQEVSSASEGSSFDPIYPQTLGSVNILTVWNENTDPSSFEAECLFTSEYLEYSTKAIVTPTDTSGKYVYLCDTTNVVESNLLDDSQTTLSVLNDIEPGVYEVSLNLKGAGNLAQGEIIIMSPPSISEASPSCTTLSQSEGDERLIELLVDGDMYTEKGSWSLLIYDREYDLTQYSDSVWGFTVSGPQDESYIFTRHLDKFFLKYTMDDSVPIVFIQKDFEYHEFMPPEVIRLSPSSGMASDASWLAIEGTYFYQNSKVGCEWQVKFNDTISESVETLSPERIIALIPLESTDTSTFFTVYISLDGENWFGGLDFFVYAQLNLYSLSPAYGSTLGGTIIYIESGSPLSASSLTSNMLCSFKFQNDPSTPTVYSNAFISNSSTIVCQSPTGFADGGLFSVEVSLNGVDFSNSGLEFAMYAIYGTSPIAGPASGGFDLTISGDGFVTATEAVGSNKILCKIGDKVVTASSYNESTITCEVPESPGGSNYYAQESLEFSFDGETFIELNSNLIYFEDPIVDSFSPSNLPLSGGTIYLYGSSFRPEMVDDTDAVCIYDGTTEGTLEYISEEEISCKFESFSSDGSGDNSGLNIYGDGIYFDIGELNITFTFYGVSYFEPSSTPYNFATSIWVVGSNFKSSLSYECVFGGTVIQVTTTAYYVNSSFLTCESPDIGLISGYDKLVVPLELYINENKGSTSNSGNTFFFYQNPILASVSPSSESLKTATPLTVTSDPSISFANALLHTESFILDEYPPYIICNFEEFGETVATYIDETHITCMSPDNPDLYNQVQESTLNLTVAMNGYSFVDGYGIPYNVTGNSSFSSLWYIIGSIIGGLILMMVIIKVLGYFQGGGDPNEERRYEQLSQ